MSKTEEKEDRVTPVPIKRPTGHSGFLGRHRMVEVSEDSTFLQLRIYIISGKCHKTDLVEQLGAIGR